MKHRIRIKRRDGVKQHYWIGRASKKNYGSFLEKPKLKHVHQAVKLGFKHQDKDESNLGFNLKKIERQIYPESMRPDLSKDLRVIVKDNKLVGTTELLKAKTPKGDMTIVKNLYITPESRKKGIGSKFVENLFKNPNVIAISGASDKDATGFWEKQGAEFSENPHIMFSAFDEKPFHITRDSFNKIKKTT